MESTKIGKVEAIGTVITIMMTHIIINLPQNLIKSTGSSTPLNVIYITIIALLFCYVISKLFKLFPGYDIFEIAEFLAGKWLRIVFEILFIAYLLFMTSLVLRIFTLNLQIIYFSNIDISTILIVFLVGATIINKFGFRTIIKTNLVFLPLILIVMFILFAFSLSDFGSEIFLPILGYGANETFISGTSNLFALAEVNVLFLLIPHLKKQDEVKQISLTSVGVSGIYLLLAVISSMILVPSNLSFEPIFSVYYAARRISLGNFLERLDPVFIFVWIICIFSYLSIALYFILDTFKKSAKTHSSKPMTYCFVTIIFTIALCITNVGQLNFILSTYYKYVPLIFTFGVCFGILLLASIKKKFFTSSISDKLSTQSNH